MTVVVYKGSDVLGIADAWTSSCKFPRAEQVDHSLIRSITQTVEMSASISTVQLGTSRPPSSLMRPRLQGVLEDVLDMYK